MHSAEAPLVSVIITTKNEEKNIRTCLESIKHQTWKNIEIIVVDNESDDATKAISKEYTQLVFDKGPERSAQRNYGMIDIASGNFVIYIDADMLLAPKLIEACVENVNDTGVVGLHISETVLGKNYFSRVRRFERSFYDGTPIDGARFFRRDIFESVGGFDETLFAKGSGEDWDIDKEVKKYGVIKLLPCHSKSDRVIDWPLASFIAERGVEFEDIYTGIYHNESEFDLIHYLKKKLYYSQGFDGYINKWGKNDPDIKKQFGVYYRFVGVFVENKKWRKLIASPVNMLGMYFLRFLVGVSFLAHRAGFSTNQIYIKK